MNVGLVIYSQTGNTRSVAARLRDALAAAGTRATLEEVTLAVARKQGSREVQLDKLPDLAGYDILVFGSPVEAFSLSPVMAKYLGELPSLQGKRVAFVVTQGLPFRWMGGDRALRKMRALCEAKGATALGGEVVNWTQKGLEQRIGSAVESLGKLVAPGKA